jgi:hypothetical protein
LLNFNIMMEERNGKDARSYVVRDYELDWMAANKFWASSNLGDSW